MPTNNKTVRWLFAGNIIMFLTVSTVVFWSATEPFSIMTGITYWTYGKQTQRSNIKLDAPREFGNKGVPFEIDKTKTFLTSSSRGLKKDGVPSRSDEIDDYVKSKEGFEPLQSEDGDSLEESESFDGNSEDSEEDSIRLPPMPSISKSTHREQHSEKEMAKSVLEPPEEATAETSAAGANDVLHELASLPKETLAQDFVEPGNLHPPPIQEKEIQETPLGLDKEKNPHSSTLVSESSLLDDETKMLLKDLANLHPPPLDEELKESDIVKKKKTNALTLDSPFSAQKDFFGVNSVFDLVPPGGDLREEDEVDDDDDDEFDGGREIGEM